MLLFLRRLWPDIRLHRGRLLQALIGVVIAAASAAVVVYLIKPVMDKIFIAQDRHMLALLPPVLVVLYLLQGLGRYAQNYQVAWVGEDVVRRLRDRLLGHVLGFDLAFFNRLRGGELISRVTNDINRIRATLTQHIPMAIEESFKIVALVVVAIYQSPRLSFFGLIVLPLAAWPLVELARRMKRLSHRSQEKDSDITARLAEVFNNMEIIKAHSSEPFELERFERDNLEFRRINMKGVRIRLLTSPLMELVGAIGVALVVWFGGLQIIDKQMSAGQFTSFATALFMLYTPIKRLSTVSNQMFEAVAATERIFDMLNREPEICSGPRLVEGPVTEVALDDVHLSYGETKALRGVSLAAQRGETIALVGDSGGGKTSLVNLVLRLYDPTGGTVRINGIDCRELDIRDLRDRIGIVTQRVYIFNDTVAANVAYGRERDPERIEKVLRQAGAWEFVKRLSGGIDAVLDEFGTNLSGGQRQRLAIARALYKRPDILILDEATSALDNRSEAAVQDALSRVLGTLITVIIAHRLTTVQLADRIYVMRDGRIVGVGTETELLATCAEYRRLARVELTEDVTPAT